MRIPWRLKSQLFRAAGITWAAPLYFAQKYVTGRSSSPIREIRPNWTFHRDNLQRFSAVDILEFGAGKSLAQNLYLSQFGLRQTLIDLNPMLDLQLVNGAIEQLARLGVPSKGAARTPSELEAIYGIIYQAPVDMTRTPYASASFDAVISTNTLEHIPQATIPEIWREAMRLRRPGGVVTAKIDYSDHYAHTDTHIDRLNYLQFSQTQWRAHNHANHYQNRLRHQHHLDLLREAGFIIVHEEAAEPATPPALVRPENLTGSASDFHTSGFVVARKP